MGSEGTSSVTIHVTGFKKFYGVSENPTETIVTNLKDFVQKRGLPNGVVLGSCNILETAGQGALSPLYQILESAVTKQYSESPNPGRVVWLHFGANSGATKFAIEHQAFNEATFRCPDELGWKPLKSPIIAADGNISHIREVHGVPTDFLYPMLNEFHNIRLSSKQI
ncbi:hypothetical protein GIB67_011281 [Kingdonia uniflora]|uniref:Pyroglutamyl-peptidase I n=1 Tax=Kingdonia uniflora TaxID=39325 RepID=A0A7J7MNW5_9MAGN|nr:hypothetical protein GIB67_011281 [Kingdonia uniflora]